MKHPLTTTLSDMAYQFLVSQAKEEKVNKNAILEKALKLYKKMELKRQVEEGLKERQDEYRQIASEFAEAQFNALLKDE